jgi:DHA3 family macrolide efflux protein-like MFS transporter
VRSPGNFILYSVGRLVSLVGTGIQDVAIPLFILDRTGSWTMMGTFMIVSMLPRLLLYPAAGVLGDRINRKWIMVWMDVGRGGVILLLAWMATMDMMTLPVLFAAQFVVSLMNALFGPATMAMLPDIVEEEELTRANSVLGSINSLSMIVGPALGGVIYGLGGIQTALLINGVSFLASGASEVFITYQQETVGFGRIGQMVDDLKEGIGFVRSSRGLMVLLAFALGANFLAIPLFAVQMPYIMRVVIGFSARDFGFIEASFMAGLLAGNLLLGTFFSRKKVANLLNRGLLAESVLLFVLVATVHPVSLETLGYASVLLFLLLLLILLSIGICNAFVNTPITVAIQKLAPTRYRARVFSAVEVSTQAIVPIGYGVTGILLDLYPAHLVMSLVAVINSLIVILFVARYSRQVSADLKG